MKMISNNWLYLRNDGIGGSDASAILGKNPYITNQDLWYIKTGKKQAKKINNSLSEWGHNREMYMLEYFSMNHPEFLIYHNKNNHICKNKEKSFIFGSFDALIKNKYTKEHCILEFKTYQVSKIRQEWKDKIPENYYIQLLHYLLVSGLKTAYLIVEYYNYKNEIINTQEYKLDRNEKEINFLKNKEVDFWENYVLKDKLPNLIINIFGD